ncbi:MAG TPA: dihydropteroate synthase [Candidatus Rubrimentiphilum sp.]|nr:dihydropteroate synthase [Candidatus Rubrimentiphilum sp.]
MRTRGSLHVRGRTLDWGERTYVMGIVNVTPDSFSGDGIEEPDLAVAYAQTQLERGSDILDIGAESTRPGHVPVAERTELERLIPVIQKVRGRLPSAVLSVDTFKPGVLRAAADAGADILNSVWGLPRDLLDVAAELGMPVVAMHNKSEAHYDSGVVDEVLAFLEDAAARAVQAGIPAEHVILDPGIGFGKNADQNLRILQELPRVAALGFPTLLGTSRKSTIGKLTGRDPEDRIYGTAATTALAIAAGIDVVRVHDVSQTRDVVSVCDAIVRNWRPAGWT